MLAIRQEIVIQAPCERCFDLARSVDFHVESAPRIAARADGGRRTGLSTEGEYTVWSARFLGVRSSMVTQIEDYRRPAGFRDRMTTGLLHRFEHAYRFEGHAGGGCVMTDELVVAAPFRFLGRLVERAYLRARMVSLVGERLEAIKRAAESNEWRRYVVAGDSPAR